MPVVLITALSDGLMEKKESSTAFCSTQLSPGEKKQQIDKQRVLTVLGSDLHQGEEQQSQARARAVLRSTEAKDK